MPLQGFACSRCKRSLHITVQVMATGCEVCHDYTAEIFRPPYLDSPYQPFINLPNSPQSLNYGDSIELTVWLLSALSQTLIHSDIRGAVLQQYAQQPSDPQLYKKGCAQDILLCSYTWLDGHHALFAAQRWTVNPWNPPCQPLTDLLKSR